MTDFRSGYVGTLDPSQRDVTVIGAGVAGLVTAHRLDRAGYEVTLIEGSNRAGGLVETRQTEFGPAETAVHSMLASAPVISLCESLGVELSPVHVSSKSRYVWREGKAKRFPLAMSEIVETVTRAISVRAGDDWRSDEATLEDWGNRFLGPKAVQFAMNPFLRGIYAARPSELGLLATLPHLDVQPGKTLVGSLRARRRRAAAQGRASRTRSRMMAITRGSGALIEALASDLEKRLGARFRLSERVERIPEAGNVVLTVPAGAASRLLATLDSGTSELLSQVRYAPLIAVTAFCQRRDFEIEPSGVGILVPESEGRDCLGILFNSSAFPGRVKDPANHCSFTVMLGGTSRPDLLDLGESDLWKLVTRELQEILGLKGEPLGLHIARWKEAIPLYSPALPKVWESARRGWASRPGRILFGNYTGQVSVRGMIESAHRLT